MTKEDIARILYSVCRAYCATIYNWERREWEKLFDYEREEAIKEVEFFLKNPERLVELYHNVWIKRMIMNGWTYDKEYDMTTKKHHYLKPFKELPVEYQFKDYLFKSAVDILLNKLNLTLEDKEGDNKERKKS